MKTLWKNLKSWTSTSVYLSPVNWGRVFPTGHPPLLFRHALMPVSSQFGLVLFLVVPCGCIEGIQPPWCWWQGSLFDWLGVFCIKVGDDRSLKNLTQRGAYPFHTPNWSCYCDSVPWVDVAVIQSAIQWHPWAETSIPLPNAHDPVDFHIHYTLPEVFTHPWWMLQWTSMGEVITSHWSTPGNSSWPGAGWSPDHHPLVV